MILPFEGYELVGDAPRGSYSLGSVRLRFDTSSFGRKDRSLSHIRLWRVYINPSPPPSPPPVLGGVRLSIRAIEGPVLPYTPRSRHDIPRRLDHLVAIPCTIFRCNNRYLIGILSCTIKVTDTTVSKY